MDKKTDFLFVYEVKNRELDNILLLKCELERRGYKVELVETWEQMRHRKKPLKTSVIVSFALYNDDTIKYIYNFANHSCKKIVNLQWEQVFTNGGDDYRTGEKSSHGVYGIAKEAVHICWGENNYKKLKDIYNVKHAYITGNVTLDFLRNEFRNFYFSREEIISRYHLDNSKIYLFISSFSYVEMPNSIINNPLYQNQGFDVMQHCEISKKSQHQILDWFEKEIQVHPEITIVYRPHPAEVNSKRLKELSQKYGNFRVIDDMSIKQWILISDKIYTWWSTSIAEVYAAHKGCTILRPIPFPYKNELQMYNNASFITEYSEFDDTYTNDNTFPIPKDEMNQFYFVDPSQPAFIKICDLLEKVVSDDKYIVNGLDDISLPQTFVVLSNIKNTIRDYLLSNRAIYSIMKKIFKEKPILYGKDIETLKKEFDYFQTMINKNSSDTQDINKKTAMIQRILTRNF